jgi:hypothetical protein
VNEREACLAVAGLEETVVLHLDDRLRQSRFECFGRIEVMVIVQFDFTETRVRRSAQEAIDLGLRLFAGIEEGVLRRASDSVTMARRERLISPDPRCDATCVVVGLEVIDEQQKHLNRTIRHRGRCEHPPDVVREEDVVLASV